MPEPTKEDIEKWEADAQTELDADAQSEPGPIDDELEAIGALAADDESDREGFIRSHLRTEFLNSIEPWEAERSNGEKAPAVFLDDAVAIVANMAAKLTK